MRCKLVQWAKNSRQPTGEGTDNATQEEAVAALAMGRQPRASQKSTDWGALKRALTDRAEDWEQTRVNGYSRQVQRVIDELLDEIVKGGQGTGADRSEHLVKEPVAGAAPE